MKTVIQKLISILLSVFFLFSIAGCKDESNSSDLAQKDNYKLYLNETFNSVEDLSDCQGYQNWYYYCGDPEIDTLSYLTYNDYYGRWCSKFHTLYYSTYIWGTSWLPDGVQGYGIGMGFKAPATGKLNIFVELQLVMPAEISNSDGIVFTISDRRGDPYDGLTLDKEDGGKEFIIDATIDVKMGEEVLFMLYANSNNTHDCTDVNITINYVE